MLNTTTVSRKGIAWEEIDDSSPVVGWGYSLLMHTLWLCDCQNKRSTHMTVATSLHAPLFQDMQTKLRRRGSVQIC